MSTKQNLDWNRNEKSYKKDLIYTEQELPYL